MQRTHVLLASLLLLMAAGIVAGLVALAVASGEDVTPPVITDVRAHVSPSSVLITWTTDEPATTEVWFDPSAGDNTYGGMASSGAAFEVNPWGGKPPLSKSHSIRIGAQRPLEPDTTYTYTVYSVDAAGNGAGSNEYTFTTLPLP